MANDTAIKKTKLKTAIILLRKLPHPSMGTPVIHGSLHNAENYSPEFQGTQFDWRSVITSHYEEVPGDDAAARAAREESRKRRVIRELQKIAVDHLLSFRALRVYDATRSAKPKMVGERRLRRTSK
jgi:hypothetical protein